MQKIIQCHDCVWKKSLCIPLAVVLLGWCGNDTFWKEALLLDLLNDEIPVSNEISSHLGCVDFYTRHTVVGQHLPWIQLKNTDQYFATATKTLSTNHVSLIWVFFFSAIDFRHRNPLNFEVRVSFQHNLVIFFYREMGGSSSVMELSSLKTVKRTRDNNPTEHLDGQQKKPKLTPSQLKLVAINDDCLEAIFDYLELMDLINVAESHSRFKFPAQWVYSHQYSMKKVILSLVKTVTNAAHSIDIDEQMALPLFRHFGNLISKLSINFMGQQAQTIEKSLLTNYADSLTELELILCHRDHFDNLSRPLENIEKLKISKSLLGKKLSQLSIWWVSNTFPSGIDCGGDLWYKRDCITRTFFVHLTFFHRFPNIVELELIQVEFTHPKSFESHFDQLKSLVIRHNEDLIESSTINEMLRLNRQVIFSFTFRFIPPCSIRSIFILLLSHIINIFISFQSIELISYKNWFNFSTFDIFQLETLVLQIELDFEFVQSIGEHLTELETLEVWAPIDRFYSFGDDKICFENVKNFTLNTQFEWGEFLVNVPFE